MKKNRYVVFLILLNIIFCSESIYSQNLEANFKNPPPETRPRTWMHVMSGNMSKVGMTKDLEAMADAGIGGIILFNVNHFIPNGPIIFNSPEHIDITAHAAAECERLGLTFGIHNCDGWTSSGGPWVTPEHSMKQIVYREMLVDGGDVNLQLPQPSARGDFYQDVAVVAYPALESEKVDWNTQPKVSSSSPEFNCEIATDGRIDERTSLNASKGKLAWVQFDYGQAHTVRSFYLNCEKKRTKGITFLQSSDDGIHFKDVQDFEVLRQGKKEYAIDQHFEGVTARYFRFTTDMFFDISEINLSSTYRFNNMLARTNLFKVENHRLPKIDEAPANMTVKKDDIINLTQHLDKDGMLTVSLPDGKWTIMRFGYTITGAVNSPASEEGRGWEVDKMSRASFRTFYEGYVRNVIDASKKVAPNALQYIEIDSYEVGGQNWTKDYQKYFKAHFNYDIMDFLPLYAGRYIDDAETTDRILWDVRNFNSKLMTDNYFDYFTEMCHEDGLISYVEPYSFNAGFNELDAAKNVDIPMGEFWMHQRNYQTQTAVSAARIYGKNIISSEAFSAPPEMNWKGYPGSMKYTGDKAWSLGINEYFFHRYAHQANTKVKPGMTMSQWGSHIDRNQTWWNNAGKDWFKYIARGQYILRQGKPMSDVLLFVGDGSPNSIIKRKFINPKMPNHINFDCINADALINRISAKNGKLMLPDGLRYHALYLPKVKEMRLTTLRKIASLADAGILIVGNKPTKLGGYLVTDEEKAEYEKLVEKVWSKSTTQVKVEWDEFFAQNNIPIDLKIEREEEINFIHRKTDDADIYFFFNPNTDDRIYDCTFNVDGKIPELWDQKTGEIVKLSSFKHVNGQTQVAIPLQANASRFIVFRESSDGLQSVAPEYALQNAHVGFELDNNNELTFELEENGKYEIDLADGSKKQVSAKAIPEAIVIEGSWKVSFPDIKKGSKEFEFAELMDWTSHEVEGVKHYSGTATYSKSFNVDKDVLTTVNKIELDLGEVNVISRVVVNGEDLGVVWVAPYIFNITSALKAGENELQVEITNQWTNRLIGDENFPNVSEYSLRSHLRGKPLLGQNPNKIPKWYTNNQPAPLGKRSTFTTYPFYKKGDELLPAGLVGPVEIKISIVKKINK